MHGGLDTVIQISPSPHTRLLPKQKLTIDMKPIGFSTMLTGILCCTSIYWVYENGLNSDVFTITLLVLTFTMLAVNIFVGLGVYQKLKAIDEAQYEEYVQKAAMMVTHEKLPSHLASPVWVEQNRHRGLQRDVV